MRVVVNQHTAEVVYLTAPLRRVVNGEWVMGVISEDDAFNEAVSNGVADERENWLTWVPPDIDAVQAFVGVGREELASRFAATISDGQVTAVELNPAWEPPEAPPDPVALLTEAVSKNVAASPHDKRFLNQKEIGKELIAWIKANPTATADQAEAHILGLIAAEMPGEPVITKLYWEDTSGNPHGLAMSYLYEAIERGYMPAGTPMTWDSLVGLVVATPEDQINKWLRTL